MRIRDETNTHEANPSKRPLALACTRCLIWKFNGYAGRACERRRRQRGRKPRESREVFAGSIRDALLVDAVDILATKASIARRQVRRFPSDLEELLVVAPRRLTGFWPSTRVVARSADCLAAARWRFSRCLMSLDQGCWTGLLAHAHDWMWCHWSIS